MTGRTCRIAQTGLQGQSALGGPSFSCLWLVLWSKAKAKIQTTRNSCKKQRKRPLFNQKEGVLWSCYPDLNRRPHPYQLIGRIGFAAFRPFCTLFTPGCHPFRSSCVHCLRPLVSPCGSACGSAKMVPLKISTTISKAQYFTHRRFLSVFNCSRRGAGTLGSNF